MKFLVVFPPPSIYQRCSTIKITASSSVASAQSYSRSTTLFSSVSTIFSSIYFFAAYKVINFIVCLVSYSFQLISEVLDLLRQITCLMFGLFRQPFVGSSFLGSRSSILLQFLFKLLGIEGHLFHHWPNLGSERMIVEYGFGMLPIQLPLLIKGSESMFIIDGTKDFRCCPLWRLDGRLEKGHFLEDCVSIFNVLGLPEVMFFLDGDQNIWRHSSLSTNSFGSITFNCQNYRICCINWSNFRGTQTFNLF